MAAWIDPDDGLIEKKKNGIDGNTFDTVDHYADLSKRKRKFGVGVDVEEEAEVEDEFDELFDEENVNDGDESTTRAATAAFSAWATLRTDGVMPAGGRATSSKASGCTALAFHPTQQAICAVASRSRRIYLYRCAEQPAAVSSLQSVYIEDCSMTNVYFAGATKMVAFGHQPRFWLWDLVSGQVETVGPLLGKTSSLSSQRSQKRQNYNNALCTADGSQLMIMTADRDCLLVDVKSRQLRDTLRVPGTAPSASSAASAVSSLAAASNYRKKKKREQRWRGEQAAAAPLREKPAARRGAMAFGGTKGGNQHLFAASSGLGQVAIWDLRRGKRPLHLFQDQGALGVTSLAFSETSDLLACGSRSGIINVYNLKTDLDFPGNSSSSISSTPVVHRLGKKPSLSFGNLTTPVSQMLFCEAASDSLPAAGTGAERRLSMLAFSHANDRSMRVFSMEESAKSGVCLSFWPTLKTPLGKVRAMAWSGTSSRLIGIGNQQGKVLIYKMNQ